MFEEKKESDLKQFTAAVRRQRERFDSVSSLNISPDLPPSADVSRPVSDLTNAQQAVKGFNAEEEERPEVSMLARGNTTVFPREDNVYEKKESLAFDEA